MKPKSKIIAVLLTACLVFMLLPTVAFAADAPVLQGAAVIENGAAVELTFNKDMAPPESGSAGFVVKFVNSDKQVTAAQLNGTDNKKIRLTLTTTVKGGEDVWLSYTPGTVSAADGGVLAAISPYYFSNNLPRPVLDSSSPPGGTRNVPYSHTFATSGGQEPYTFNDGGGLPTGLTLDPVTGVLSGTPTASGSFNFGIYVVDSNSAIDSSNFTISIAEANNVCQVGATQYATLDDALGTVGAGQTATIKLLDNITYNKGLEIAGGQNITFDLDGHTLNIVTNSGIGLLVTSGHVAYTNPATAGAFHVTGYTCGVSANGGGASIAVSSATATFDGGNGAVALNGGDVVVDGNVQGGYNGASAAGVGSTIIVNGNVTGTSDPVSSAGASAGVGGSITINGGNAQGLMYGVYANGDNALITVNNGNAMGTGTYSHGIHAEGGGSIHVTGNVQGTQYGAVVSGTSSSATIGGIVTVTTAVNGWGVDVESSGTVHVGGNVVVNGQSLGVFATSSGNATIDGAIQAQPSKYIQIYNTVTQQPVYLDGSPGSRTEPTTKDGYYTYSAGPSTVWVKIPAADATPPVWTSGYPHTFNLQDEDFILVVSADEACTVYYVVLADGAAAPSAVQVENQRDAGGSTTTGGSFLYNTPQNDRNHYVGGLTPESAYDVYVVLKDSAGNLQTGPARIDVTTLPYFDAVPNDANSGITGQAAGTAGSRQVTLTVTVRNAAGQDITGLAPGDFGVSINGGPARQFVNSPFSGFTDKGDGTYTVVFTGDTDNTAYSFTNLTLFGVVIEAGPTTVTTPAAGTSPGGNGGGGGSSTPAQTYKADVSGIGTRRTTLPVNVNAGSAMTDLSTLTGDIFADEVTTVITMPPISGVNSYTLSIPASSLSVSQGEDVLTLAANVGSITIPADMLAGISGAEGKKVGVTIGQGDKSHLSDELKTAIGGRPLVQLTLTLDGTQTLWNNPDAPVTVSIPYSPTAAELTNPESIVIWYIDGSGNAVPVSNGRYDSATGKVTFSITHFSQYAITFVEKTFSDLSSTEWARKSIEVIASKGIINGTSENTFSPAAGITRADYLVLLVNTLGLTADFDGNFNDVQLDAYYYEAAGIAKELGIASGNGNNRFNPKERISRQDMIVLTARALEKFKELKAESDTTVLNQFSDKGDIAGYAEGSLTTLIKEGLISGSGDKLNPRADTTRAEAAVFLYRIYNKY